MPTTSQRRTPDEQLQLFPSEGSPTKPALSRRPAQPADNNPHHDPHQLQLLINPTEHIRRMENSTDTGAMGIHRNAGTDTVGSDLYDADIHSAGPNPAPNRSMNLLWRAKEAEAREPEGSYAHGSGMYDLINSGEQIREPIQVRLGSKPEYDQQYEGHHRVAAGHAVQQDRGPGYGPGSVWLPVKYDYADYHYVQREAHADEKRANAKVKANRPAQEPEVGGGRRPLGTTTNQAIDNLVGVLQPKPHERRQSNGAYGDMKAANEIRNWVQDQRAGAQPAFGTEQARYGGQSDGTFTRDLAKSGPYPPQPTGTTTNRLREAIGHAGANIKQADPSLERLLNDEESIARNARPQLAPDTYDKRKGKARAAAFSPPKGRRIPLTEM